MNGVEPTRFKFVTPLQGFLDPRLMAGLLAGIDQLRDVLESIVSRQRANSS